MNTAAQNIYRFEKHEWTPLLSFGSGRTRTVSDGWHSYPYSCPFIRTMGVRYKDATGTVVNNQVAYRRDSTYVTYNTQAGYVCEIKHPPSAVIAIWYRYANVDQILVPMSQMPNLRILSFREHMINFGNLDLSAQSKFSHFEISKGGSITSVTFHPDAPLKFAYLDSGYPVQVKDAVLTQAYNHRNTALDFAATNTKQLIGMTGYSASLQYMVDDLVNNYGWSIS